MPTDDPAIKEVRDARHEISRAVGHDPKQLVEYYMRLQERHRDRIVKRRDNDDKDAASS